MRGAGGQAAPDRFRDRRADFPAIAAFARANVGGGSHQALADTGAGYCVFNDLALAANRLIEEGDVSRILILDLDVHQGDGTAALTAGCSDIFTLSIHAEKNFPTRKARSSLDVGLPDATGDAGYLAQLEHRLRQYRFFSTR